MAQPPCLNINKYKIRTDSGDIFIGHGEETGDSRGLTSRCVVVGLVYPRGSGAPGGPESREVVV